MIGTSVIARIAATASATSSRSENVSTMKPSRPPSRRASACSRNAASASSGVTVPSGARYFPRGPIEPSTNTSRPELSRTSRASATPRRLTAPRRRLSSYGMRLPECGQNARDDLVGADPGRVDRDVRQPVVGLSRPIERFDVGHRASLEHGPIADPAGALVQLVHVAVEPHDRPELTQELHPAFTARQTTAGRDDLPRLQLEALERVGLELTEPRLARVAEDLGDRAALAGDDHVVGLDEARSEEHTSELQSRQYLVCRLLLEKKNIYDWDWVTAGQDMGRALRLNEQCPMGHLFKANYFVARDSVSAASAERRPAVDMRPFYAP